MLRAALIYFAGVFIVATALGALRTLVVAPALGPFVAVLLEVPLILAISWVVAGIVLRRYPVFPSQRLGMGAVAFLILMIVEAAVSTAFGTDWLDSLVTPAGIAGLLAQIGFGLIPALRR